MRPLLRVASQPNPVHDPAVQARKVELAEPALRHHRAMRDAAYYANSYNAADELEMEYTGDSGRMMAKTVQHGRRSHQRNKMEPPGTARSEESLMTDHPNRTKLVDAKALDNDGEWDLIVQYNQREGRRIAAMAQQEIAKKKVENKAYLDVQARSRTAAQRNADGAAWLSPHHTVAPTHLPDPTLTPKAGA